MKKSRVRRRTAGARAQPRTVQAGSAWRNTYSLGVGLLFISIFALTSPTLPSMMTGAILFLTGLYFLHASRYMRKKKRDSLGELASLKILQSLILVEIGLVLMVTLPENYFGSSLLITLFGFFMFAYVKFKFYAK